MTYFPRDCNHTPPRTDCADCQEASVVAKDALGERMTGPLTCRDCGKPATHEVTGSGVEGLRCDKCSDLLGVPPAYRASLDAFEVFDAPDGMKGIRVTGVSG